jgi:hypothetical protein
MGKSITLAVAWEGRRAGENRVLPFVQDDNIVCIEELATIEDFGLQFGDPGC